MGFENQIKELLYGLGDESEPLNDSVELLQTILIDFLLKTWVKAAKLANNKHFTVDHFFFSFRDNWAQIRRADCLLNFDKSTLKLRKKKNKDVEKNIFLNENMNLYVLFLITCFIDLK